MYNCIMRALSRTSSAVLGLLFWSAVVYGQSTSGTHTSSQSSTSPSSTSSAPAQTHTVSVGNGDNKFVPDVTQADVGDIIEFQFFPPKHSVVRAEYEYPCIPYEMTGEDKVGFFSGFRPVDAVLSNPPTWQLRVNDSNPVFFYCSAAGSCTQYGMVGVINPNASTSLSLQRSLALNSSYQLNPGDPFPAEGSPTAPPTLLTTSTSSATSVPTSHSKSKLSAGVIVAIVVAAIAAIVLGGALFFFIGRSKTLEQEAERKDSTLRHISPTSPVFSPGMWERRDEPPLPSYFASYTPNGADGEAGAGAEEWRELTRRETHRSTGGTFDLSPLGYHYRTFDGEDAGKGMSPQPLWNHHQQQQGEVRAFGMQYTPPAGYNGNLRSPGSYPVPMEAPSYFEIQPNAPVEMDGREVGRKV